MFSIVKNYAPIIPNFKHTFYNLTLLQDYIDSANYI